MEKPEQSRRFKVIIAILAVSLTLFLATIIFWQTFKFTILIRSFNYVVQNIVNISGFSIWLAKAFVTLSFIPLLWAVTEALGFRPKFNIFKKEPVRSYKKVAYVVIILYISGFFGTMYFLGKGMYFGHSKGEASKYYAITPEGIRFFDTAGYDPKYGIELKPVTPKLVEYMERAKRGLKPNRVQITPSTEYFDSITGQPRLWYFLHPKEGYEFYDQPGFHPVYLEELRPVSQEVVVDFKSKLEEEKTERDAKLEEAAHREAIEVRRNLIESAVLTSHPNSPNHIELGLLIAESSKAPSESSQSLADIISDGLSNSNIEVVRGFFKPAIFSLENFDHIISGNSQIITNLGLANYIDNVVVLNIRRSFDKDPRLNDLVSCRLSVNTSILSAKTGGVIASGSLSDVGIGIDQERAGSQAIEKIAVKALAFITSHIHN